MRLVRLDEVLLTSSKPALVQFDRCTLEEGDVLVMCAGFEDRAIEALSKLEGNNKGFDAVLIEYRPEMTGNKSQAISAALHSQGARLISTIYDRENPAGFGSKFLDLARVATGKLVIDISAMSRLLVVQLLVAIKQEPKLLQKTIILYTEAGSYPPSKGEVEQILMKRRDDPTYAIHFLSSGVFEITVVPELSSISLAGEQTRLVAFPSFNVDQLTALRAELQPSRFVLVHGLPPREENEWRCDAIKRINSTEGLRAEEISVSTLDYRQTLDALLEMYNLHGERDRIVVCPTGSKMQAVAVGLFRAFLDDVQIVYPTPKTFQTENYTTGIGASHCLDLSFFAFVK